MTLMLLDSASLYFRSFFGVPNRFYAEDGTPVNAARGFADAIGRLVTGYQPSHLIACWDNDWRPQFRVDLVPTYKLHRVADDAEPDVEEVPDELSPQVPIMADYLGALGITRLGVDGYEADDVIAHCSRLWDGPVDIVTGDRDLFQLVNDKTRVRVIYTGKGMSNLQVVTDDWLVNKYGVPGSQYADMATLRGDASDGLPGIKGIGDKTAATLIHKFGSLANLLAAAKVGDGQVAAGIVKKLAGQDEYISAAQAAVTLDRDLQVPLPDCPLPTTPVDPARLVEIVDRNNLESPMNRLLGALRGNPAT